MAHLDPRHPLVIDTRHVGRRAGAMADTRRDVTLDEPIGTDVCSVPAGSPIHLDLRLEAVMEGVLVSADVVAEASGACVRCLEEVAVPVQARFQELYTYPDKADHRSAVGDEDPIPTMDGDLIDLHDAVFDAVVPQLPFQPLCDEDCPGLCSRCGASMREAPGHVHEDLDPRWAALSGLTSSGDTGTPSAPTSSPAGVAREAAAE